MPKIFQIYLPARRQDNETHSFTLHWHLLKSNTAAFSFALSVETLFEFQIFIRNFSEKAFFKHKRTKITIIYDNILYSCFFPFSGYCKFGVLFQCQILSNLTYNYALFSTRKIRLHFEAVSDSSGAPRVRISVIFIFLSRKKEQKSNFLRNSPQCYTGVDT